MNEESLVKKVRLRAIERRKELESDPNTDEEWFTCMQIAEKFLRHPKGFAVSEPIMSLAVLKFLGYSEEEIKDMYFKLVYEQSNNPEYTYVNPNEFEEGLDKCK